MGLLNFSTQLSDVFAMIIFAIINLLVDDIVSSFYICMVVSFITSVVWFPILHYINPRKKKEELND